MRCDILIKLNFSGSYYDIGVQAGNLLKASFQLPPATKPTIEFAQKCREHVKQYSPGILNELQGIIDITGFDSTLLDAFVLSLGKDMIDRARELALQGIDFGCSSLAISSDHSATNSPLFARNYDWTESFKEYFTVIKNDPKDGISNLSFTDHAVGRYGGVNKAGLAMSMHVIPFYKTEWSPGLRMNVITRWILDNFKNTKEAVNFLEKIPHICGHIYLIADKKNNISRVETAKDEVIVTDSTEGFMAITNHYETKRLKKHEDKRINFPNSHERLNKMRNWYERRDSKITIEELKYFLSSHEEGVCNHFEFGGDVTSTIWSWIANIGTDEIFISDGSPCAHPYELLKF